jgi:ribosome-binding protein aMBF1 (putative translation factor)
MLVKSKPHSAKPDIQRDFAAHVEASRRAREWAAKCLAYRAGGKTALAKNAEQQARRWLKIAMTLETQASDRSRVSNQI